MHFSRPRRTDRQTTGLHRPSDTPPAGHRCRRCSRRTPQLGTAAAVTRSSSSARRRSAFRLTATALVNGEPTLALVCADRNRPASLTACRPKSRMPIRSAAPSSRSGGCGRCAKYGNTMPVPVASSGVHSALTAVPAHELVPRHTAPRAVPRVRAARRRFMLVTTNLNKHPDARFTTATARRA